MNVSLYILSNCFKKNIAIFPREDYNYTIYTLGQTYIPATRAVTLPLFLAVAGWKAVALAPGQVARPSSSSVFCGIRFRNKYIAR